MVNPSGNATVRGQMTRALMANISVRTHFLWDDFWPSNGQIMPWGRGLYGRGFGHFPSFLEVCVVVFLTHIVPFFMSHFLIPVQ